MAVVEDQAVKAGLFFGEELRDRRSNRLAVLVPNDDPLQVTLFVVATGKSAVELKRALDAGGFALPDGISAPRPPHIERAQGVEPPSVQEPPARTDTDQVERRDEPVSASAASFPLVPRYHVPQSQVWEGSAGRAHGNVHLHVTEDRKVGRRVRKKGECLCSKKHGSMERPPEALELERWQCTECFEVAAANDLTWEG